MPSTSVHLPEQLLRRLDQLAADTDTSRNRLIVRACEAFVEQAGGEWPPGFFKDPAVSDADLRELAGGATEMMRAIVHARRSRKKAPF